EVQSVSRMVNVAYVRQKEALGLGHAVLVAKELIGDEPFAVILSDDIIDSQTPCLKQLVSAYERYGHSIISTTRVEGPAISRFGVLDVEAVSERTYRIRDMVEKPPADQAPSNLAIIGRYILTPEIFPALERTPRGSGGEIQLTDAMRLLLKEQPMYAYEFEGTRHDAGDKLGFLIATVEYALKRPDLGPEFREYLKQMKF
ncbi:MAG TPA: UTP--glucose-1-phosphate uridylyltransferase, partial [Acidobacteriota bacterium]|nr:UTP--glucose-1-phosphate uridylyltransferase [Acidobacteriota bacterium]